MSTTAATGFCRVTVVAPDSRIDVALPEDIAVADIYPEILRLTGQTQAAGNPTGYHLVRRDGTVLDGARTLAAQQVLDGELLSLRPFAQSLPPAVFDDVSDAVASAVTRDRHLWSDELLRGAGLLGGVLLLVLMGFVLWFADPVRHDMHSLPGIIAGSAGLLLTAFAGVRAGSTGTAPPRSRSASARCPSYSSQAPASSVRTPARAPAGCSSCSAACPSWSRPSSWSL